VEEHWLWGRTAIQAIRGHHFNYHRQRCATGICFGAMLAAVAGS